MQNTDNTLVENITSFLEKHGINPIYVAAMIGIIISYSNFKYLKNWDNLPYWKKSTIITTFMATVFLIIVSIIICIATI